MGWKMKNGSIPYPEGAAVMQGILTAPTPLTVWRGRNGMLPFIPLSASLPPFGCFANAAELREFRYRGTMAQWENVQLGSSWKTNAPFTQIVCKDGELSCR